MNILFNIEEKMIRVNKYLYENKCIKAKRLLEDILEEEPDCGAAHFEMGMIYYHELAEYDTALYHFELCKRFKPGFIPVYHVTVQLLYQLNKQETLIKYADSCLKIDGVNKFFVYKHLAMSCETTLLFKPAIKYYKQAKLYAIHEHDITFIKNSLSRIKEKSVIKNRK